MTNYLPDTLEIGEPPDFLDFDPGEPPDWDDADLGEPPDTPDDRIAEPALDEPPDDYSPPGYLVGVADELLKAAPPLDAPNLVQDEAQPSLNVAADPVQTLWDTYSESVFAGQNLGGSEVDLIARAEQINLVDARFLGSTDAQGYHVSAIEVAADVASGDLYGQTLAIASFDDPQQAEELYFALQGQIDAQNLPNYAVADFASHVALEYGTPLDWQPAVDADLERYEQHLGLDAVSDEPPDRLVDDLVQNYADIDLAGVSMDNEPDSIVMEEAEPDFPDDPPEDVLDTLLQDYAQASLFDLDDPSGLFDVPPEPPQPLDYGIDLVQTEAGQMAVELVKEVDGGLRYGGLEDRTTISVHDDPSEAIGIAQDLTDLRDEVWELTDGDLTAGWQAMASLAYEIGTGSGQIEAGEPLFARPDLPPDPFELQPADVLLAQYEALSQDASIQDDVALSMDM